jgi:competence ComEA-like helix-hairpin-helix protein
MPQEIFVSPLPAVADRPVQLPLEKIIPQLPEHFFNSRLDQESLPIDSSFFPTPFGPDPVVRTVTPVAAEPAPASAPIIEPPAKPEVVEAKPVEFVVPAVAAPVAEVEKPVEVAAVTATELEDAIAEETIAPAPVAEEIVATSVVEAPPPVAEAAEAASPVMGESPVAEAPLSPMEQRQFLIDINKCSAEDLTRIPGVGPSLAQRIVAFREEHGQITDINQLRQVPGVGNKTFRRIIGGSSAARGKIGRLVNYLLDAPQDQELTIQEIVRLTAQLPGVQGCIMAMDDGLYVTGHVPPPLDAQTISAFGPQLFRRVSRYVRELQAGRVRRFSLFTDQYPVSMFHAGRIFLVVIHQPNRFSKTLLRRCERIAQEINLMCTERVTV